MVKTPDEIWRDYVTDGVPSSGSHDPEKPDIRDWANYVETLVQAGVSRRLEAVRVATTANGTLATAFDNGSTIDGVTLATNDRILIKDQSDATVNGVYIVQASGAPVRATDADAIAELYNSVVFVTEGTANAGTTWYCTIAADATLGADDIDWLLTGDASAITNDSVTNAKLANMATATMKGRATAGTGDPEDLTPTQAKTVLALERVDNTADADKDADLNPFPFLDTRPNLWWLPKVGRELPSYMSYACAAVATVFNRNGELEDAAINQVRLNHSVFKSVEPGLAVEAASTNLVVDKRDLTQSSWVKTDMTATQNARGITGVGSSCTRLTATDANATVLQSITSASATRYTSAFVKRVTGTGTIEMTQDGGSTWIEIIVLDSDWKRFVIPSAAVANPQVGFRIATSGDEIAVDWVECESGGWTSPKNVADESRDSATLTMTLPDGFDPAGFIEGTIFFRARVYPDNSSQVLVSIDDGSNDNRMGITLTSANVPNMVAVSSASTVVNSSMGGAALGLGEEVVFAMRYKANDWRMACKGRDAVVDTSGALPSGVTTINFGRTGAASFAGTFDLLEFALFPRALSDGEMDDLVNAVPLKKTYGSNVIVTQFGGEGNDYCFVRLPDNYRRRGDPHPMVICHHGNGWTMNGTEAKANFTDITMFGVDSDNGGTYLDMSRTDYLKYSNPVIEALRGAGFVVCGAQNYGDALYGNKDCRNAVVDFYQWMQKNFNVKPRCHMLGASNGAMSMLNACHLLGADLVASIAAIYPLVSLLDHYVDHSPHQAGIETAYGLSAGPHDKATLLTFEELYSHCPVNDYVIGASESTTQKTRAFPPMIMIASGGDTVVDPAANAELLKALCDRSRLICYYTDIDPGGSSGYGHGHYEHFKDAEILAFFQANK